MSSITPLTFTGISDFSDDFQTILNRAVQIASLPVQVLQNDQTKLLSKKTAMADLRTKTASMSSAVSALAALGKSRAIAATSSSYKVSVAVTGSASAGSYTISDITSLASVASATSTTGFATADQTQVSVAGNYLQLVVGGQTYDLDLSGGKDNLNGVVETINGLDAGVTATIINTQSETNPYFLTLTATSSGETALELRTEKDSAASNLLSATSAGSNASFKINGQTVTSSSNRVFGVIPGIDFTLNDLTDEGETVTLTAASSKTPLISALRTFVTAYNTLTAALDAQTGTSGGVLVGDRLLYQTYSLLRSMFTYQGSDGAGNLGDLGLSFDASGTLSLDESAVNSMTPDQLNKAINFLGSSTTGLGAFASSLDEFSDPITGFMTAELKSYDDTDSRLSTQISDMTDRINASQATLVAQLQAADTLLAQLASQQNLLTAQIQSLNYILYGKQEQQQ